MRPLSPDRIAEAMHAIDPVFLRSPLLRETSLGRATGVDLQLKVETLNPIRSFKGRGTEYLLNTLKDHRTLVCASAGNFGQGLARAAAKRNRPVIVFAARDANALKVSAMRELGAEVRMFGADFDAAKDAARRFSAQTGSFYIEDGAIPEIAEGAGTIAFEMSEAGSVPDVVLLPLGNGALATGIGAWLRYAEPATRVIAVVAASAPAMRLSFAAKSPVTTDTANTIADGIAVREPVAYAVECMRDTIDEVIAVSDDAIIRAMRLIHGHVGLVVEPAGAVGIAALLEHGARWKGARVGTVLCGGNVTQEDAKRWFIAPSGKT